MEGNDGIVPLNAVRDSVAEISGDEMNRLLAYSIYSLKTKYKVKFEQKMLGKTAKDFMQEAFESILSGNRQWNRKAYPQILDLIKGAIDSRIEGFLRNKNRKNTANQESSFFRDNDVGSANIEDSIIRGEKTAMLRACFEGDDDEEIVFECILDGIWPPREIAEFLEWEISKVNNVLRRLRRKRDSIKQKMKEHGLA